MGEPTVGSIDEGPDGTRNVTVSLSLTNTGSRAGVEVVQAHAAEILGSHPAAWRTLRGFTRSEIGTGESAVVDVKVAVQAGTTEVWVGPSADPPALVRVPL